MKDKNELMRFLDAQNQMYLKALAEIRNGKKISHWMWFIFPQLQGLGKSDTARFYAIKDLEEARAYLNHPILGKHLLEITEALLSLPEQSPTVIFGTPDDLKLCSSMTLFSNIAEAPAVFGTVIEKYFNGEADTRTLELLGAYSPEG